ncbi:Hypothetical protein FKW44_012875, partial [Caligus rogercresseyi]
MNQQISSVILNGAASGLEDPQRIDFSRERICNRSIGRSELILPIVQKWRRYAKNLFVRRSPGLEWILFSEIPQSLE